MRSNLSITWWRVAEDHSQEVFAEHMMLLNEEGYKRAYEMMLQGYRSGELSLEVEVEIEEDEEEQDQENVLYRGHWKKETLI